MVKPKWNSKSVGEYERSLKPKVEDDADIQEYKKPWVGLTDEDWDELLNNALTRSDTIMATEAKLKDKNT